MSGRKPTIHWLITAEHASRAVPRRWAWLFADDPAVLDTHRAWDPGSQAMATRLATHWGAPLLKGRITRLLVDLNRSANHPRRFSEYSRRLPVAERVRLHQDYWQPHWAAYADWLHRLPGRIVHVACHSFTPVFEGRVRPTDIGLLYDPARAAERAFCCEVAHALRLAFPQWRIHMNQPYRGTSNGLGQQHRSYHDDDRLITFEIEVNQRLLGRLDAISEAVIDALESAARALA